MIKIAKPFKDATPQSITQGFSQQHQANDFSTPYGTFIVAPFNAKVQHIVQAETFDETTQQMQTGCGILITSIEDPTLRFAPWHCLPTFPVNVGDIVLQGQPIAQVGNTGFVQGWNGQTIITYSVEEREQEEANSSPTNLPKKGVHTHISFGQGDGTAEGTVNLDYSKYIDWTIPVNYNLITAIRSVLQHISNLLTNK